MTMLTLRMRTRMTVTLFIEGEAATFPRVLSPLLSNPVFHLSPIAAAWSIHLYLSMILTINIRRVRIPALLTKLLITNPFVTKVVGAMDPEMEVLPSLHF